MVLRSLKKMKSNIIRKILISKKVLNLLSFILERLPGNKVNVILLKIKNKIIKLEQIDYKSVQFNRNMYKHHMHSSRSKSYSKLLRKLKSRKMK